VSKQIEAVNALRAMNAEELDEHLHEQRRKLFEVRFQQAAGQVDNHRQIRELRMEIARTMTIQVEVAHGHRLASEAALESGVSEPEDQPRRRRLFRRGARAAEGQGTDTEMDVSPDAAPEGEAGVEVPEQLPEWNETEVDAAEKEAVLAGDEAETFGGAEAESPGSEGADIESPEEAAAESGSGAATENQG
jgi:large subunit ribosomal protein L29